MGNTTMYIFMALLYVVYSFMIFKIELSNLIKQQHYWDSVPYGDLEYYNRPYKKAFSLTFILNPVSWFFYWGYIIITKIRPENAKH